MVVGQQARAELLGQRYIERVGGREIVPGRGTTSARCPCGSFSDAALPNPA
jgi:hypothetical protein